MNPRCARLTLLASALASMPVAAFGQESPAPATPEACVVIATDANRLACYDAALGRQAVDTLAADAAAIIAAAEQAGRQREAAPPDADTTLYERARHGAGAVSREDDPYAEARTNAGKGSLLDSRWELASDSNLGVFQMRAYRPVYLLPVLWTSNFNETPLFPRP